MRMPLAKVEKIRQLLRGWDKSRDSVFDIEIDTRASKYVAPAKFITIEEDTQSQSPQFLLKFNTNAVIPKSIDEESMKTIMPFLKSYNKYYLVLPLEKIKIETDDSTNETVLAFRAFGKVPFNIVGKYLYYAGYEAGNLISLNSFLTLSHIRPQNGYKAYLKYSQSVKQQEIFLIVWGKLSQLQNGEYKFEYSPFFYLNTNDPLIRHFYEFLGVKVQNLSISPNKSIENSFFRNNESLFRRFVDYRNTVYWDLNNRQIKVVQARKSIGPAVETLAAGFFSSVLRLKPNSAEELSQIAKKLLSQMQLRLLKKKPLATLYAIPPIGDFKKAILSRVVVNMKTQDTIVYETQMPFQSSSNSTPLLTSFKFRYRVFRAPSSCWNILQLKQLYKEQMDFSDSVLFIFVPEFLESKEGFDNISLFPLDILQI